MRQLKALPLFILFLLISPRAMHATSWQIPTPEELSMKSDPAAPGAVAIILNHNEINNDNLHTTDIYERIKILTEDGKQYGDITIPYPGRVVSIQNFRGRTIHSDGTIAEYAGRGLNQIMVKGKNWNASKKMYAMPDVQVGSIVEVQYSLLYGDMSVMAPRWNVQSELFTRKARYEFVPFNLAGREISIIDKHGQSIYDVAYSALLPPGPRPVQTQEPTTAAEMALNSGKPTRPTWILEMTNISALPKASHLAPVKATQYRVQFYYSSAKTAEEFWKKEGGFWSKDVNSFAKPGTAVTTATKSMASGSDDQKLRAIYAGVMQLQNTNFLQAGDVSAAEDKNIAKNADDVWMRKRGSANQLTSLFVAMARAAGMKAYVMGVTPRDEDFFQKNYFSFDQLSDEIAIVQVDGKDQYFDPGSLYCPYGSLAWKHSSTGGLRQKDSGTELANTPPLGYKDSQSQRTAKLWLAEDGSIRGTVQLVYRGQRALELRQQEADKDLAGASKDFEDKLQGMLPAGSNVRLTNVSSLKDGEQPLVLEYWIHGPYATVQSKHLLAPSQLFVFNQKQNFIAAERKYPVYFHYPFIMSDQVELTLPSTVTVDELPKDQQASDPMVGLYRATAAQNDTKVTFGRMFAMAQIYVDTKDYAPLQKFYGDAHTDDTTPAIFKRSGTSK